MDSSRPWGQPRWAVLFSALLLMATGARADGSGDGYQSGQGTHLHGTSPDWGETVSIPFNSARYKGAPLKEVRLDKGQLTGTLPDGTVLRGTDFNDVTFSATVNNKPVTFIISGSKPHQNVYVPNAVPSSTTWDYQVDWTPPNGGGSLCPDKQRQPALALPYRWSSGQMVLDPFVFSFACLPKKNADGVYTGGGVAAKCVDWGYAPWVTDDPTPDNRKLAFPDDAAKKHHVACVAMATADYCGEGKPNTVNGTPIVMFDDENVKGQPGQTDKNTTYVYGGPLGTGKAFAFEAAWTATPGLDDIGKYSAYRGMAQCLTKKRWSTLPLGGTCFDKSRRNRSPHQAALAA